MIDTCNQTEPELPFSLPKSNAYSIECNSKSNFFTIHIPYGKLIYYEPFFSTKISDYCLDYFLANSKGNWREIDWRCINQSQLANIEFTHIEWKQDKIKLFGKTMPLPRLTAWYGDPNRSYTYSGITSHPIPWNRELLVIKQQIEQATSTAFNSVLMNWYRDGNDSMGWHADNEPSLGKNPIIASVSLGETRDFILRRNSDHSQKITIPLKHGTLLIMKDDIQDHWQHAIPKRKNIISSRINLTFRKIIEPSK